MKRKNLGISRTNVHLDGLYFEVKGPITLLPAYIGADLMERLTSLLDKKKTGFMLFKIFTIHDLAWKFQRHTESLEMSKNTEMRLNKKKSIVSLCFFTHEQFTTHHEFVHVISVSKSWQT